MELKLKPVFITLLITSSLTLIGQNVFSQKSSYPVYRLHHSFINTIKNYYHDSYGKGTRLEESVEDDSLYLLDYYRIPDKMDDSEQRLTLITIPLNQGINLYEANPILFGDLNNDNIDDLIITVHTDGDGTGASTDHQEIFVFMNIRGLYVLSCVVQDTDLAPDCVGWFRAKKIRKNQLIGQTTCYKEYIHPGGIPINENETTVEFVNNRLKVISNKVIRTY
ncbi:hypothetical protein D4R99_00920 [bacterium]|nr:MAG: hypothetical protein D4R99_00920 [bacterium]